MRASPDDILGMAFFARVVEARSFSDAARSLGLSKSAVSARVARLEERLGVRLLHRTTRRLALTADGVRLYERCARVVAEADEAAEIAAGASAAPRGVLRVHAAPAFAQLHLTGPIRDFMIANPEVRVELRLGDRVPDLAADGLDVSIVVLQRLPDSGLVAKKLATARVVACAAPSYLRRKGIPFRPQDLVLHQCLAHSVLQFEDWYFETEEGPVAMRAGAKIVVDERGFLREAAIAGLGIVMLPDILVAEDLASGRLHRVLDDFQTIELTVNALHPHGRHAPASVRAFLDHLAVCFRQPPWQPAPTASASVSAARPVRRGKHLAIPMTEQDARRLEAVAKLYSDVDEEGAARVREALARTKVVVASEIPASTVTMSSRVLCRDDAGNDHELAVVYPWDAAGHRLSVLSESGCALLGASIGNTVKHGGRVLRIASIPYQPEAAGDHHL
jgi:DNA-binding transcriptional LysR family regulator/transcription elongation GreA/GreB family factor